MEGLCMQKKVLLFGLEKGEKRSYEKGMARCGVYNAGH